MQGNIVGNVLPLQAAEELLSTLPGVVSARIIAGPDGAVGEVHVLMTTEFTPKQMVRNIESALIAQLGMKADHRKISVATTVATSDAKPMRTAAPVTGAATVAELDASESRRRLYFEDVEVRRSRTKGVACRVTLRKDETS